MAQGRGASSEAQGIDTNAQDPRELTWPEAVLGASGPGSGNSTGTGGANAGAGAMEVALLWGDRLLDVQRLAAGEAPSIGHSPQARLHVFDRAVGARFELLRFEGNERFLRIPSEARFALFDAQGQRVRSGHGAEVRELPLRSGERAMLALSQLCLTLREVGPASRVRVNPFVAGDYAFFKVAAITALFAIAVVAVGRVSLDHQVFVDDELRLSRTVISKLRPVAPKPPPVPVATAVEAARKLDEATAKAARDDAPKSRQPPRTVDMDDVGLLGAMNKTRGGVFGAGGDEALNTAYNNLGKGRNVVGLGPETGIGASRGPSGGGDGTGGLEWGGGVGTLPRRPSGSPFGDLDGRIRGTVTPTSPERTRVAGNGLDREQIAKVIRDHQKEIKFCYENALREDPELAGKVAVSFVIDPSGAVSEADVSETTLESAGAERCMLSRIKRWKFPQPRGGGVVAVNFPWLFRPAGASGE